MIHPQIKGKIIHQIRCFLSKQLEVFFPFDWIFRNLSNPKLYGNWNVPSKDNMYIEISYFYCILTDGTPLVKAELLNLNGLKTL